MMAASTPTSDPLHRRPWRPRQTTTATGATGCRPLAVALFVPGRRPSRADCQCHRPIPSAATAGGRPAGGEGRRWPKATDHHDEDLRARDQALLRHHHRHHRARRCSRRAVIHSRSAVLGEPARRRRWPIAEGEAAGHGRYADLGLRPGRARTGRGRMGGVGRRRRRQAGDERERVAEAPTGGGGRPRGSNSHSRPPRRPEQTPETAKVDRRR